MGDHHLSEIVLERSSGLQDDRLASFMSQDPTYFVFRRFCALNLRNLLRLQREVLSLEHRIEQIKTQFSAGEAASRCEHLMLEADEAIHRYSPCPSSPMCFWFRSAWKCGNTECVMADIDKIGHR